MISFKEDHTAGEAFQGSADPGQARMSAKSPINLYKGRYDIMAKVGLKDTLALLANGYSKKDIDKLAAIDEAQEAQAEQKTEGPAKNVNQEIAQEHIDKMNELLAQIKEKEEQLSGQNFARCSASVLVNLRYVDGLYGDEVSVGTERIRIGRSRKKDFMTRLNEYLGG